MPLPVGTEPLDVVVVVSVVSVVGELDLDVVAIAVGAVELEGAGAVPGMHWE